MQRERPSLKIDRHPAETVGPKAETRKPPPTLLAAVAEAGDNLCSYWDSLDDGTPVMWLAQAMKALAHYHAGCKRRVAGHYGA